MALRLLLSTANLLASLLDAISWVQACFGPKNLRSLLAVAVVESPLVDAPVCLSSGPNLQAELHCHTKRGRTGLIFERGESSKKPLKQ